MGPTMQSSTTQNTQTSLAQLSGFEVQKRDIKAKLDLQRIQNEAAAEAQQVGHDFAVDELDMQFENAKTAAQQQAEMVAAQSETDFGHQQQLNSQEGDQRMEQDAQRAEAEMRLESVRQEFEKENFEAVRKMDDENWERTQKEQRRREGFELMKDQLTVDSQMAVSRLQAMYELKSLEADAKTAAMKSTIALTQANKLEAMENLNVQLEEATQARIQSMQAVSDALTPGLNRAFNNLKSKAGMGDRLMNDLLGMFSGGEDSDKRAVQAALTSNILGDVLYAREAAFQAVSGEITSALSEEALSSLGEGPGRAFLASLPVILSAGMNREYQTRILGRSKAAQQATATIDAEAKKLVAAGVPPEFLLGAFKSLAAQVNERGLAPGTGAGIEKARKLLYDGLSKAADTVSTSVSGKTMRGKSLEVLLPQLIRDVQAGKPIQLSEAQLAKLPPELQESLREVLKHSTDEKSFAELQVQLENASTEMKAKGLYDMNLELEAAITELRREAQEKRAPKE